MNSRYPLHIEKQFENIYKNAINKISKFVIPRIKQQFNIDQEKQFDADNFGDLENGMNEYLDDVLFASGYLEKEIRKIAKLLDSWALAQTNVSIKKLKRITRKNAKEFIPVLIDKENPFVADFIESYTKFNKELVSQLGHEYIPEISNLAQKTFIEGRGIKELSKELLEFTEGKKNKAVFWAQDQTGDAFSSFTKIRQTQAGFPGYKWRTVGDGRVRPAHGFLEGLYFTWAKGAVGLDKPGAKHPGQDYRCRCYAEPSFGPDGLI